ncbi:MAG: hypothetical protein ABR861_12900 [Terriglobales bacterium]
MNAGTQLAIRRMCALTGVSRAGFYRRGVRFRSAPVEFRDQVQRVALEWPTYGSRRISGVAPLRPARQSQTGAAGDAGRQPARFAAA